MSFILDGGSYEWKITNNLLTIGAENLLGGKLTDGLYTRIGIGNTIAKQLELSLWNVDIDPSYPLILNVEAVASDGTITTIGKGTYFVDTIDKSPYSEYSKVTAFDALLKAEVPYMKSGTWVETTDYAVALQIANDIGVSLESGTESLLGGNPMTINEVPSIGDNGTTSRELLSVIAVMRGGNFIINDDNELQFVLLGGALPISPSVVYIDSDNDLATKAIEALESADNVVSFDGNGDFSVIAFSTVTGSTKLWYVGADGNFYADTWTNIQAISPVDPSQTIVVGDEVVEFDVSPTETIKRVELWASGTTSYRSPSGLTEEEWDALGGIVLSASMPIMASQDLADDLFSAYENFTYVPYSARTAYVDPDVRLCATLAIKDDTVLLTNRTLSVDVLSPSDLSADPTEQQASYYPYMSPIERAIQTETVKNSARISISEAAIASEVIRAKDAEEQISSAITQTAEGFRVELNDFKSGLNSYMSYENGTLTLGDKNADIKSEFKNDKWAIVGKNGQDAQWIDENSVNGNDFVAYNSYQVVAASGRWVTRTPNNRFQIKWKAN